MTDLLTGAGQRDDYIALIASTGSSTRPSREAATRMRTDPVASVFLQGRLSRLPALEADLAFLIGADWRERIAPLPTTQAYVSRIRRVAATWPGVSSPTTTPPARRSVGRSVDRAPDAAPVRFRDQRHRLPAVRRHRRSKAFKTVYREQLDAAPWDDREKERVIAEVLVAYRFTTELFADLTRAKGHKVA